ncbi:MAG: cyclic pyranopterin monophosphate synthase [Planctomycetota bacterium]|jgi:cyclic pyranopterin phosphate synthase
MAHEGGMIDVTGKAVTVRTAKASGRIELGPEAFEVLRSGSCVKGDVLGIAKAAAIQAVKSIEVDFALNEEDKSVTAAVTVKSCGKTGVEMEALCGAAVACLSIYDMLKYVSREMTVTDLRLIEKTGGKSGDFKRQD